MTTRDSMRAALEAAATGAERAPAPEPDPTPEPEPERTTKRPGRRAARPVVAYMTAKERAAVDAAAARDGLAVSAWARLTLLRAARGG
mgnify:CR=1 FL=1